uniref:Uncharacterized protein n=1 Tax=Physcomitrium patens TaxID=3218 RepID=A0A2K1ISN0_PHYPA|nr:hypothetical protein PHYPA_026410 [Physcomitrium patens]
MAAVAYIPLSAVASARLATTQASSSNAASQPSAGIVAFKRAVTPSCLSASQFCGVPVTFSNSSSSSSLVEVSASMSTARVGQCASMSIARGGGFVLVDLRAAIVTWWMSVGGNCAVLPAGHS